MANYITVDGGTTNTRVHLVLDGTVVDRIKLSVGAKNGIDGKNSLKSALHDAIETILARNGLNVRDVERILASGMITSEFGLCPLKHITIPAGIKELREGMHETVISEISEIPFAFVRGVITDCIDLDRADMIRGEETELMGILREGNKDVLYVLPGSHSKLISVDRQGKIVDFRTMLTGELFFAVSQNTILKNAVEITPEGFDEAQLLNGYEYCLSHGINEALFKVRILKNVFGMTAQVCYSFLLGVILCGEVREIVKAEESTVILGGQKQLREALKILLSQCSHKNIISLSDAEVENSTANGAIRIYEMKITE